MERKEFQLVCTPVSYTHLDVYKRQAMDMLEELKSTDKLKSEAGVDCRNYGLLDGIPEARRLLGEMTEVTPVSYTHLFHGLKPNGKVILYHAYHHLTVLGALALQMVYFFCNQTLGICDALSLFCLMLISLCLLYTSGAGIFQLLLLPVGILKMEIPCIVCLSLIHI